MPNSYEDTEKETQVWRLLEIIYARVTACALQQHRLHSSQMCMCVLLATLLNT